MILFKLSIYTKRTNKTNSYCGGIGPGGDRMAEATASDAAAVVHFLLRFRLSSFNEMIIGNARNWIVSITKDKLEYINSNYQFDQFDQFDEKITFEEFELLVRGYEY